MPSGYSDVIRLFAKVSKPVYACLRQQGYLSVIFVDNLHLQADPKQKCLQNI